MKRKIRALALIIISVVIVILVFKLFFFITRNTSVSMQPLVYEDSFSVALRRQKLSRGDCILFYAADEAVGDKIILQKRVVGLPGETVELIGGNVYIDGKMLYEEYISDDIYTGSLFSDYYIVPENSYFVLGDNRDFSDDSRVWENPYVESKNIIGKTIMVLDF